MILDRTEQRALVADGTSFDFDFTAILSKVVKHELGCPTLEEIYLGYMTTGHF